MINNSGLNRVIELLNNDLTIIAIGTGEAPNKISTQLNLELLRKVPSDVLIDGYTLIKELYLDESEGNGVITELGILGSGANINARTGELFASDAATISKNDTQSLTISFEIEVKEVTF